MLLVPQLARGPQQRREIDGHAPEEDAGLDNVTAGTPPIFSLSSFLLSRFCWFTDHLPPSPIFQKIIIIVRENGELAP